MEEILPFIDDPDPILNILGTLSILYNRIKNKYIVYKINQDGKLQIKMEDKYYNEMVLQLFLGILNLHHEIVTDKSDDD